MHTPRARLRFYGDLGELARGTDRAGEIDVPVGSGRTVKDAVEACGIPHTEVDLLVVDGRKVGFDHPLEPGARVAVYPPFRTLEVHSPVRPPPLDEPRFVCDVHLGRLAELLRLLGFDTLWSADLDDADLAALSAAGPRWLLTRDRGLLMRRIVAHGHLVRTTDPRAQLREVARRFDLGRQLAPRTRCARCNALLEPVEKAEITHRLEPGTRAEHEAFLRCTGCGQLYWEGSHAPAIDAIVADVRHAGGASGGA